MTMSKVSMTKGMVSLTNEMIPLTMGIVSKTEEMIYLTKKMIPLTMEVISMTKGMVLLTKKMDSITKEMISLTKEIVSMIKEMVLLTKEIISMVKEMAGFCAETPSLTIFRHFREILTRKWLNLPVISRHSSAPCGRPVFANPVRLLKSFNPVLTVDLAGTTLAISADDLTRNGESMAVNVCKL